MAGDGGAGAHPAPRKRQRAAAARPDPIPAAATVPVASLAPLPRATHRMLVMRGLDPEQAANLTAYLNGIPVAHHTWSLREINRLLFLREMAHREGWEH